MKLTLHTSDVTTQFLDLRIVLEWRNGVVELHVRIVSALSIDALCQLGSCEFSDF